MVNIFLSVSNSAAIAIMITSDTSSSPTNTTATAQNTVSTSIQSQPNEKQQHGGTPLSIPNNTKNQHLTRATNNPLPRLWCQPTIHSWPCTKSTLPIHKVSKVLWGYYCNILPLFYPHRRRRGKWRVAIYHATWSGRLCCLILQGRTRYDYNSSADFYATTDDYHKTISTR